MERTGAHGDSQASPPLLHAGSPEPSHPLHPTQPGPAGGGCSPLPPCTHGLGPKQLVWLDSPNLREPGPLFRPYRFLCLLHPDLASPASGTFWKHLGPVPYPLKTPPDVLSLTREASSNHSTETTRKNARDPPKWGPSPHLRAVSPDLQPQASRGLGRGGWRARARLGGADAASC